MSVFEKEYGKSESTVFPWDRTMNLEFSGKFGKTFGKSNLWGRWYDRRSENLRDRIQYQYDEVNKCRLVLIDEIYILVDPEDLEFWAKEMGLSLSEDDKKAVTDYLTNTQEPLGNDVERTGSVISLPGVRIYRKAK